MKQLVLLLFAILIFSTCRPTEKSDELKSNQELLFEKDSAFINFPFSYDFESEPKTFFLSGQLREISGLTITSDGEYLMAVNDEQGKIFILDIKTGEIVDEIKFGKSGDYEGLEMVGDKIYVVKSDGSIYEVKDWKAETPEVKIYFTELTARNNVEGLGYDKSNNRLLLACKGIAARGKDYKYKRAIYAFELDSMILLEKPIYLMDQQIVKKMTKRESKWFVDPLPDFFMPSGIAVHPDSGNIYVLASTGRVLLILNSKGELLHIERLNENHGPQPEGICFGKDKELYISSEGKGKLGNGKVFIFNPI